MATKEVKYKISQSGAEKVSGQMGKVDKSMASMAKGALAAVGGIYALKKAYEATIGASIKQEQTFRKLQTSVELTGKSWGTAKGELDAMFASLQATTEYGDTESAEVFTTLMQLTSDYDKSVKALPMALDLAATGLFDAGTAAKYVAMAMEGNVQMLGRYIPELRAESNEIVKSGTSAQKTAEFMRIFNDKFSGTAQKNLNSTAAQMKQLGNYLQDIGEAVGDYALPALTHLAKILSKVMGIEAAKNAKSVGEATGLFSARVSELSKAFSDSGKDIELFGKATKLTSIRQKELKDSFDAGNISLENYKYQLELLYNGLQRIADQNGIVVNTNEKIVESLGLTEIQFKELIVAIKEMEMAAVDAGNVNINFDVDPTIKQIRAAVNYMDQFSSSMAQAAIYGQDMGDAVVSSLKAIAAQLAAKAAVYTLLSLFFPGAGVAAGMMTGGASTTFLGAMFGFNKGGIVPDKPIQYFASGGSARGSDTVPAMLTPGEVILNKAQQNNLAGNMGNTYNINIGRFIGTQENARELAKILEEDSTNGYNKIMVKN